MLVLVVEPSKTWVEGLARKAMASGALIRDAGGRVLLVEPAYKATWEIPGGMVEAGESPAAACGRELLEELGLPLPVGRLLVLDWAISVPGRGDGVRFIYDGGYLPDGATLTLPEEEIVSARFVDLAAVGALCAAGLATRVWAAVGAADRGEVVELEGGVPRLQAP